jgi:hypothetical protein
MACMSLYTQAPLLQCWQLLAGIHCPSTGWWLHRAWRQVAQRDNTCLACARP